MKARSRGRGREKAGMRNEDSGIGLYGTGFDWTVRASEANGWVVQMELVLVSGGGGVGIGGGREGGDRDRDRRVLVSRNWGFQTCRLGWAGLSGAGLRSGDIRKVGSGQVSVREVGPINLDEGVIQAKVEDERARMIMNGERKRRMDRR